MWSTVLWVIALYHVTSALSNTQGHDKVSLKYRDMVTRAQCHAECVARYGTPRHEPDNRSDLYGDEECKPKMVCQTKACKECLQPCNSVIGGLDTCKRHCVSRSCVRSCQFMYLLKDNIDLDKSIPISKRRTDIGKPEVTCHNPSAKMSRATGQHYSVGFMKWTLPSTGDTTQEPVYLTSYRSKISSNVTDWRPILVSDDGWRKITGMTPGTEFQFQVLPVLPDGASGQAKLTQWIKTLSENEANHKPIPNPTSVKLVRQEQVRGQLFAVIQWEMPPGSSSCEYMVALLPHHETASDEQTTVKVAVPLYRFETPLMYGIEYSVRVATCWSAGNKQRCSDETTSTTFTAQSCLQANHHSYTKCAPDPPQDMDASVSAEKLVQNSTTGDCEADVLVRWLPPPHASPDNSVLYYLIRWEKYMMNPRSLYTQFQYSSANVSGQTTSLLVQGLHADSTFTFIISAVSAGGESERLAVRLDTTVTLPECKPLGITNGHDAFRNNTELKGKYQAAGPDSHMAVLIGVPASTCLMCIIIIIIFKCRNKKNPVELEVVPAPRNNENDVVRLSENPLYTSLNLDRADDSTDPYEINPSRLTLGPSVGEGAFGRVVRADLQQPKKSVSGKERPTVVAVKMIKEHASHEDRQSLLLEIEAMKLLGHHTNIVGLVGCCTTGPDIYLVMDYCPLGNLRAYMRNSRKQFAPVFDHQSGSVLTGVSMIPSCDSGLEPQSRKGSLTSTSTTRASFGSRGSTCRSSGSVSSVDSAKPSSPDHVYSGSKSDLMEPETASNVFRECPLMFEDDSITQVKMISYSRQIAAGMEYLSSKKFVHRDLAARNILVCDCNMVKISDFGLTRDIYESNMYNKKSMSKVPIRWMSVEALFDQIYTTKSDVWSFGILLWEIVTLGGSPYPGIGTTELFQLLKKGYRMEQPDNCPTELFQIMKACWKTYPGDRPSFRDLRLDLDRMLQTATQGQCSYMDVLHDTCFPEQNSDIAPTKDVALVETGAKK